MKFFVTLCLIGILMLVAQSTDALESSSYSIEQIPLEQAMPTTIGESDLIVSEEAVHEQVVASDYMQTPQLMDFNVNGVVARAIYAQDSEKSVALDYGLTTGDKTTLLLAEKNTYMDRIAIRVANGNLYPHTLSIRILEAPRTLSSDVLRGTICNSEMPCTLQQAAIWDGGELGLGYRLEGERAGWEFAHTAAYRSYQTTPAAQSLGRWIKAASSAPDATYQFIIKAELEPSQKTSTYWGRMQYVLWPDF